MPNDLTIPKIEEKILKFWKDRDIFKKSLELRKDGKRFVFFEGPPTANNHPKIHHFIGRAFKDVFVRYKTMRGYYVPRKAGWDTHGLPVELEIEKELGIKTKKEIEAFGIAQFNTKAKASVWKYKEEWEHFTDRTGFWLDMTHPYITYQPEYMETLWWIIKEISDRGLLYEGYKVLPWCTRCGTGLSSHEVAQEYHDVTDTSVYVKFVLKSGQKIKKQSLPEGAAILAWTTTPWTLPGNVALAVGKNISYVLVKKDDQYLIAAKDLVGKLIEGTEVIAEYTGKDLIGLEYEPLFDITPLKSSKSYKVYPADFVTTTDGTGIVHTAVMYGEDDYKLGIELGLPAIHTVDEFGMFRSNVPELSGQYVKNPETEKQILAYLTDRGLLFRQEAYPHSYPFCWRCKTPLLYYARDSWFVAMSKLRKQLAKNNSKVNWVPAHLRDGRFGEFIKEAKDWAFSRERYWGTPLPVWRCEQCTATRTVGSLEELNQYRYRKANTFYIMRHGHSVKNGADTTEAVISSKLDQDTYDLTEEGRKQVHERAAMLKEHGGVDAIYASPFLRTRQTAEILSKELGLEYTVMPGLREFDHGGGCEGHLAMSCPFEFANQTLDTRKHEDSETWRQLRVRMYEVLRELDDKYEGKKIVVVSHGDPLWLFESILLPTQLTNDKAFGDRHAHYLKEGELRSYEFKNYPYSTMGELDMHRPYIDDISLACHKCTGRMTRVKEVVDVWFDSGAMPFAQWHYPFENKKEFDQSFPADFISEGIDQTRGWFYTLLAISTLLDKGPVYKNVVSYSHVLDAQGRKMSKSGPNSVDPQAAIETYGADAVRWYFYSVNNPGDSKMFALQTSLKSSTALLNNLLNSLNFFELYDKPTGTHPKIKPKQQNILDQWILSRLHSLIASTTQLMDDYDPTTATREIESFLLSDLSNWWIRRSREAFQRPKDKKTFNNAFDLLRYLLFESSKLLAPFAPFMADHLYKRVANEKESVHLEDWPKAKKSLINLDLEKTMTDVRSAITLGLAQRKTKNIKVRQPLTSVTIKRSEKFDLGLEELIKAELNVKQVIYTALIEPEIILDEHISHELLIEGYARELMRQLQDMRKEVGYKVDDKAFGAWQADHPDVIATFEHFEKEIAHVASLKELSRGHREDIAYDVEKEFELAPGVKVWLAVRK